MRESLLFFFGVTPATEIYPLSLHDALPISDGDVFLAVYASHWVTPTERFLMASLSLITQMGPKKFPRGNSLNPNASILQKLLYGRQNVACLRQDDVLQLRLVRAEGIHRGNA